ncbi:chitosanase [Sediminibacterium soli]|uniref:chitosanase n=1 Tax=Sediminibacterium soli TaxID=2698829 RepID=UPI00137AB50C|nr:chitosanase [Sediminibacterium soli]NCI46098.1 chitosanase [Sediminibacterium soli]
MKLIVKAKKLNKRKSVPAYLPDPKNIAGTVNENFVFEGEEVLNTPNPSLGKWYRDRDNYFYWGGALNILEEPADDQDSQLAVTDNGILEKIPITPSVKKKIEQVVNVFETGSGEGDYAQLSIFADYSDPDTGTRIRQITYGRSQTTEFGHLKELVGEYIDNNGRFASEMKTYLPRIGQKPSLEKNEPFRDLLKKAGKEDPLMKTTQDAFFDSKYYQPAFAWFSANGFALPLSMLVIYDSFIHSGTILSFLRKRFSTPVPSNGGDEKEWTENYVTARHNWLSTHRDPILRKTNYRTQCFIEQIATHNWNLWLRINAHGVMIG